MTEPVPILAEEVNKLSPPCKKCTGRGYHFLTCPTLKLKPGWLDRLTAGPEDIPLDDLDLEL